MNKGASLYFHSPCFDGIVSAVVVSDFLESSQGWSFERFSPVDYDYRLDWLTAELHRPCAVVDFLYHPQATFWADHHSTTFVTPEAKKDFEQRTDCRWLYFNDRLGSCALLLWDRLADSFGYRNPKYAEMVLWADKIDSARYTSVEEAILGQAPALRIRASMSLKKDATYFERLVKALRAATLDEVALQPDVNRDAEEVQARVRAGLQRFGPVARLDDNGIVVFDVDSEDALISRYAPYYFFPQARYSVGIVRSEGRAKITAMRNPWREFPSLPLGKIFEKFGGGGHQRVGSLLLDGDRISTARAVLDQIVTEIHSQDAVSDFLTSTV
jgi:hypothetical protein